LFLKENQKKKETLNQDLSVKNLLM